MSTKVKYPRTYHIPQSPKRGNDDKVIKSMSVFKDKKIVITEKMDGENTTMYPDYIHARSIDSRNHLSRSWVKGFHAKIKYLIPDHVRICGENMYARHTIEYDNLESYFLGFAIFEYNTCLSWDKTLEHFDRLGIKTPPVLYRGPSTPCAVNEIIHNKDYQEGFVIRNEEAFRIEEWHDNIAKYVSEDFEISTEHWTKGPLIKNNLAV